MDDALTFFLFHTARAMKPLRTMRMLKGTTEPSTTFSMEYRLESLLTTATPT
jgi:hypothetical protein